MQRPVRSVRAIAIALVLCIIPLAASAQQAKKPITHDVYDSWKTIQGTKISIDGAWLAYALVPQDGDGELVVRNLKTSAEVRAPHLRLTIFASGIDRLITQLFFPIQHCCASS